jgi:hypothetical protein
VLRQRAWAAGRGELSTTRYTSARTGQATAPIGVEDAHGPVYLIVDGHPAHRATATKEFAASTKGRLRLVFLPGYSPELNPGEWVWKNVKVRHEASVSRAG